MWDSKLKFVNACGKIDQTFTVYLNQTVYNKTKYLMNKFNRLEWLGYLIGGIEYEKKEAYVNDIMIPKQTVSSVVVKDISAPIGKQYIGVIHSHHHMSNNFSGTDHDFINQNNDISILITHKEITGQIRMKTECGCFYIIPITIKPNVDKLVDNEFIESINTNIVIDGVNDDTKKLMDITTSNNNFNIRDRYRYPLIQSFETIKDESVKDVYQLIKENKSDMLWDDSYDEDEQEDDSYLAELDKRKYVFHNNHRFYYQEEEEEEEIIIKKKNIWTT